MACFPARISPLWRLPMLVVGATPNNSYVELDDDALVVRFGWFNDRIPLAEISGAERTKWRFIDGLGVRFNRETMAYVGSRDGTVKVHMRAPRRFPAPFGMQITRGSVTVALLDPDGFIAELGRRLAG
jgi:hypothetical protein